MFKIIKQTRVMGIGDHFKNGVNTKRLKGLTVLIIMCMCFFTIQVKAQYVSSVSTDKNSYPKGETIIATASISSSVYYTVFYLKDNTQSGTAALDKSGNIYRYNTTTPKATFNTSTLTAGKDYYVYAVAYNSSGTIIDNTGNFSRRNSYYEYFIF